MREETERKAMSTVLDAGANGISGCRARRRATNASARIRPLAFKDLISDVQYQAGVAFADLYLFLATT